MEPEYNIDITAGLILNVVSIILWYLAVMAKHKYGDSAFSVIALIGFSVSLAGFGLLIGEDISGYQFILGILLNLFYMIILLYAFGCIEKKRSKKKAMNNNH